MPQATKNNVTEPNTDVAKQMAVLREDIANLTSAVAQYGKAQGSRLKSHAADTASDIADGVSHAASAVKARAEKTYSDTEDAVRANPGMAIGIAAGLGFLAGMLTARR